jgi:hypothetical protein
VSATRRPCQVTFWIFTFAELKTISFTDHIVATSALAGKSNLDSLFVRGLLHRSMSVYCGFAKKTNIGIAKPA